LRHDSDTPFAGSSTQRERRRITGNRLNGALKRVFDIVVSATFLLLLSPVVILLAVAIKLESPGPVFYRCRRVGRNGSDLAMLKFRKMHDGAEGPALASTNDERFTRLGPFLAKTKLDEIPQLWNVIRGEMSLVGPRPEDPRFVEPNPSLFEKALSVRPGITGLSQLAFARESEVLDPADRVGDYIRRILPQKLHMDELYAERRSLAMDARILSWTAAATLLRRHVAVHRSTGRMSSRAPRETVRPIAVEQPQMR
jgi:lipopolysaccharide/colanic/teichoic acid biosynthesis glycosyltransferase